MTNSKQRSFTAEFKAQVVLEVISGRKSFMQACRQYQISEQALSRWKRDFLEHAGSVFEQPGASRQESERLAELERLIGQLTFELELAKKACSLLNSASSRNGSWR